MKSVLEEVLEGVGIRVRDADGNIRSPEDLTEDVMALAMECEVEDVYRLLFLIALARHMDNDKLID